MAEPKTWDLLASIVTCLEVITVANGYYTDAGNFVTQEPEQIPDDKEACIGVVLETLDKPTDAALRTVGRLMTIAIVGKVNVDIDEAQLQVHRLIADIDRALTGRNDQFPIGAQHPVFQSAEPIPPADGVTWVGAKLRYTAHVRVR